MAADHWKGGSVFPDHNGGESQVQTNVPKPPHQKVGVSVDGRRLVDGDPFAVAYGRDVLRSAPTQEYRTKEPSAFYARLHALFWWRGTCTPRVRVTAPDGSEITSPRQIEWENFGYLTLGLLSGAEIVNVLPLPDAPATK